MLKSGGTSLPDGNVSWLPGKIFRVPGDVPEGAFDHLARGEFEVLRAAEPGQYRTAALASGDVTSPIHTETRPMKPAKAPAGRRPRAKNKEGK